MKSPFPGMDPYLQDHWRDVHASLMIYARDQIQERLPADLIARVEEGISIDSGDEGRIVYPDVRVVEDRTRGAGGNGAAGSVAVAEPLLVEVDELPQRHIEIVEPGSGHRVVTAIELLSPTNKQTIAGLHEYRRKQGEYIAGGVNLVEVDLIRGGDFILAASQTKIPKKRRTVYAACVRRVTRPREAAIYPIKLRERLPTIPIPLRPKDRDVVLNLQDLIELCYERGRYHTLDYDDPLDPPLPAADAAWAQQLIASWRQR